MLGRLPGSFVCSSSLTQFFVLGYFEQGDWRRYLEDLVGIYRRRRDVMLEALEEHFGGRAHWTRPEGGLFIWATLEGNVDTTDLLARSGFQFLSWFQHKLKRSGRFLRRRVLPIDHEPKFQFAFRRRFYVQFTEKRVICERQAIACVIHLQPAAER